MAYIKSHTANPTAGSNCEKVHMMSLDHIGVHFIDAPKARQANRDFGAKSLAVVQGYADYCREMCEKAKEEYITRGGREENL